VPLITGFRRTRLRRSQAIVLLVFASGVTVWFVWRTEPVANGLRFALARIRGGSSLEDRLAALIATVESRLQSRFAVAGLEYPPYEVAFLIFKDVRKLELYGRANSGDRWRHLCDYPVLGLSGTLGPKMVEGDKQVPEGIYRVEYLNPNSRFHLSIRLDYPNAFDRAKAAADGRRNPGTDIMIHGGSSSIGCIAVGNQAVEELFILAAIISKERVRIVISPTDMRQKSPPLSATQPPWVSELYRHIQDELAAYN
jgi:hypothetical protein